MNIEIEHCKISQQFILNSEIQIYAWTEVNLGFKCGEKYGTLISQIFLSWQFFSSLMAYPGFILLLHIEITKKLL